MLRAPNISRLPRVTAIAGATLAALFGISSLPNAALATTASSQGQTATAQLRLTGHLIPGACDIELSANGVVDYGNIPLKRVPENDVLRLRKKTVSFTIQCEQRMSINMTIRDEKPGTAVPGLVPNHDQFAFGLGSFNEKNIGQYRVQTVPGSVFARSSTQGMDAVDIVEARVSAPAWSSVNQAFFRADGSTLQAFSPLGTLAPGSYRRVAGELQVDTIINRRDQLPGGKIPLAGLASVEIYYK